MSTSGRYCRESLGSCIEPLSQVADLIHQLIKPGLDYRPLGRGHGLHNGSVIVT